MQDDTESERPWAIVFYPLERSKEFVAGVWLDQAGDLNVSFKQKTFIANEATRKWLDDITNVFARAILIRGEESHARDRAAILQRLLKDVCRVEIFKFHGRADGAGDE